MIVKQIVITEQKRHIGSNEATISFDGVTAEGKREHGTYGSVKISAADLDELPLGFTLKLEIE